MTTKIPRLIGSITLTSAAVVRVKTFGGTVNTDVSIPAGRYWFDPIYSGVTLSTTCPGAVETFLRLLDTGDTHSTYARVYNQVGAGNGYGWFVELASTGSDFDIQTTSATTNAQGLRFLQALGFNAVANIGSVSDLYIGMLPAWKPDRGETVDVDPSSRGFAVVVETENGTVYTADLGDPLRNRSIKFAGLPGGLVKQRYSQFNYSDENPHGDGSFESVLWFQLLSHGELFRYWANEIATLNTYTTAAMTATSATVPLGSVTGLVAHASPVGGPFCIDGEFMEITAIDTGTKTLTVARNRPVAHSAYSPASTDFVGTYSLAQSGGEVSLSGCSPKRRASNQDRWDFEIMCIPATW